jgi:NAD(P)-dependent dehydrogenase (short-subunit alcohol dehydrogenase family)
MPPFRFEDIPDLSGQVIIVTGGNVGLGYETVRQLADRRPAHIYLGARSQEKAEAAIKKILELNPNACPISHLPLDLASFDSIKSAAADFTSKESRLDVLVNNAGIMMTPEGLTQQGYELQLGTNVVGPALLTQLLLPALRATAAALNPQARVVMLSSAAHMLAPADTYKFDEFRTTMGARQTIVRYGISKLGDIHYAKAMAEREKSVKFIPLHPGIVATNLHHSFTPALLRPVLDFVARMFVTSPAQGALAQIWASVSPDAESGQYYMPIGKPDSGSKLAQNRDLQEQFFKWIQGELKGHVETIE